MFWKNLKCSIDSYSILAQQLPHPRLQTSSGSSADTLRLEYEPEEHKSVPGAGDAAQILYYKYNIIVSSLAISISIQLGHTILIMVLPLINPIIHKQTHQPPVKFRAGKLAGAVGRTHASIVNSREKVCVFQMQNKRLARRACMGTKTLGRKCTKCKKHKMGIFLIIGVKKSPDFSFRRFQRPQK